MRKNGSRTLLGRVWTATVCLEWNLRMSIKTGMKQIFYLVMYLLGKVSSTRRGGIWGGGIGYIYICMLFKVVKTWKKQTIQEWLNNYGKPILGLSCPSMRSKSGRMPWKYLSRKANFTVMFSVYSYLTPHIGVCAGLRAQVRVQKDENQDSPRWLFQGVEEGGRFWTLFISLESFS